MILFSHPVWERGLADLGAHYDAMQRSKVIAIVGCGGAGKSETNKAALRSRFAFPQMWQNNMTPVASTMGILGKNAYFSSLQFVKSARMRVLFPNNDWMLTGDERSDECIRELQRSIDRTKKLAGKVRDLSETEQWPLLQDAAREHCVQVLVIDHATAFLVNHKDTTPAEHLFNLISWSEDTGVTVVLIGAPRLAQMWRGSEELSRRVRKVWIPPYSDCGEELEQFSYVFGTMLARYPGTDLALTGMTEEVHLATGGLIGQLDALLVRAAAGGSKLTARSIRQSFIGPKEASHLWASVAAFNEARNVASKADLQAAKDIALKVRRSSGYAA